MALTDHSLSDSRLRTNLGFTTFSMRLPWYRSLPFSAVTSVFVEVGRASIAADNINFFVGSAWRGVPELAEFTTTYWFIQESVGLRIAGWTPPRGITGAELSVTLRLLLPYFPAGPQGPVIAPMAVTAMVPVDHQLPMDRID